MTVRIHPTALVDPGATLGERVEDTFLIDGAPLQHNPSQLAIEGELLDALAAPVNA